MWSIRFYQCSRNTTIALLSVKERAKSSSSLERKGISRKHTAECWKGRYFFLQFMKERLQILSSLVLVPDEKLRLLTLGQMSLNLLLINQLSSWAGYTQPLSVTSCHTWHCKRNPVTFAFFLTAFHLLGFRISASIWKCSWKPIGLFCSELQLPLGKCETTLLYCWFLFKPVIFLCLPLEREELLLQLTWGRTVSSR